MPQQREVEEFFEAQGFTVVHPELMNLSAQASTFRNARLVAGFAGSGMFNVMYSHHLEHMIVLSHDAYLARHETKFAAVRGADIDYFWSPSDLAHQGSLDPYAFFSPWDSTSVSAGLR